MLSTCASRSRACYVNSITGASAVVERKVWKTGFWQAAPAILAWATVWKPLGSIWDLSTCSLHSTRRTFLPHAIHIFIPLFFPLFLCRKSLAKRGMWRQGWCNNILLPPVTWCNKKRAGAIKVCADASSIKEVWVSVKQKNGKLGVIFAFFCFLFFLVKEKKYSRFQEEIIQKKTKSRKTRNYLRFLLFSFLSCERKEIQPLSRRNYTEENEKSENPELSSLSFASFSFS